MKFKRNERIGGIVKILSDSPNKIFTLSYFTQKFNAAKSTISEDILIVKNVFEKLNLGKVITIAGAAGGVKYIPKVSREDAKELLNELCEQINDPERILPGKFLYLIDLIYSPQIVSKVGKLFASYIDYSEADCVVTIETKGIPLALATANAMNLPLVIIRKNTKISEGSSLSINYVSASKEKIQTMSLPRKSLKEGSKVILIDDFMRGGGTLKGMEDLMKEFKADVVGKGVLISTDTPQEKLVEGCISLLRLIRIENDSVETIPNEDVIM
ncbi:purine operon repressor, PurR [Peptoclostridium litorale DSM 5388]|uniref:Pur operon repressor n=1 Tax=Peptoclostridium litorale DSM 5388 TaxID=1121324 RepID=A0A069RJ22_PEPLI|nr:pur operon repressor [Peptoclostridium litorale]KDR94247.1 Pur operon repressor [Peptoclostridium litorale DSM 5388]SIO28091.1 purine operon repressor, PurR [Peptoclostridium litorale DSM 5388]